MRNPDFAVTGYAGHCIFFNKKVGGAAIKRANFMDEYIVVLLKCLLSFLCDIKDSILKKTSHYFWALERQI